MCQRSEIGYRTRLALRGKRWAGGKGCLVFEFNETCWAEYSVIGAIAHVSQQPLELRR